MYRQEWKIFSLASQVSNTSWQLKNIQGINSVKSICGCGMDRKRKEKKTTKQTLNVLLVGEKVKGMAVQLLLEISPGAGFHADTCWYLLLLPVFVWPVPRRLLGSIYKNVQVADRTLQKVVNFVI